MRTNRRDASARQQALYLLQRREHSASELSRKLVSRGIEESAADEAISALSESGLQSDGRYAELLVRSRIARAYGPLRIRAELRVAGVSDSESAVALEDVEVDWFELARSYRERRFGPAPIDNTEQARQFRHLAGRGFETSQIRYALESED